MLELKNDKLVFSFENVHKNAVLTMDFQRTLRIPDDGVNHSLPPSLGAFPLRLIDNYKEKLPKSWVDHGGIFLPMYQSEALWINFNSSGYAYPFAIKIATGKRSAITTNEWTNGLQKEDYCVNTVQRWIDGYAIEDGLIRQFVAAPMGSGVSVEQQITGEDKFGGIQIEIFPMKASEYEKRFVIPRKRDSKIRCRGINFISESGVEGPMGPIGSIGPSGLAGSLNTNCDYSDSISEQSYGSSSFDISSMSMAAGGKMMQQIITDPYGIEVWDTENSNRCFIHLTNSMVWRAITGSEPPTVPMTSKEYASHGYKWFDYYTEAPSVSINDKSKGIKSIASLKPNLLPENESIKINSDKVVVLSDKPTPKTKIREGSW